MIERHFERIQGYTGPLPQRSTQYAAGYDIAASLSTIIEPGDIKLVRTGIKVKLGQYEYLELISRSSLARNKHLVLPNGVGIIDSDYYGNPQNDGEIMAQLWNISDVPEVVNAGERIMQGIFHSYMIADNDVANGVRVGGFGSTGV
ncbi:dUTP diphosphatase [Schleiferilactobacillus shenzhenensis]|uniref:dUTP diphosphatase n=1 Tax=Schleiferilactobacillus shenzhenensis LY-73 TaxID=1231336 RepID=U4TIL4_9LACO|nr:dUTP diphosphatase [Schleiferilactobacillus shenzhenensis]ERL64024.1 Dut [Schleiferilactobacillus shenzhenensis LY-73]